MQPTTRAPHLVDPIALLARGGDAPVEATLLDLVRAVSEETDDDREVVAAVLDLLRSGRVRLCGNFRGTIPDAA